MLDVVRLWSVVVDDYLSGIVEQVLLITRFSPSFLASHLNLIASCILIIFFIIIIALGSIHHPSIVERPPTTNSYLAEKKKVVAIRQQESTSTTGSPLATNVPATAATNRAKNTVNAFASTPTNAIVASARASSPKSI